MEKIKLFEMFAGYGGASFALKKARIPFECVGISETDKYAWQCFIQNHKGYNYGDCKIINPEDLPDFDLLTAGFPCQDVSVAGCRSLDLKGASEKEILAKGRTILFNDIIRIAKVKKPKYMLLENVVGLLSMKEFFSYILKSLNKIGYDVKYEVLKSSDYGLPQIRKRVYFVCKFGKFKKGEFKFPKKVKLKIFLKDLLEKKPSNLYLVNKTKSRLGMIVEQKRFNKQHRENMLARTVTTKRDRGTPTIIRYEKRWRHLTCVECFRLMGFLKDEINTDYLAIGKKYFLAGNGFDINLVSLIFKEMFKNGRNL